jgi:hypothetical protein
VYAGRLILWEQSLKVGKMEFKITQGKFVLRDSFSFVVIRDEPIHIKLADDMNLEFVFVDDPDNKKHSLESSIIKNTTLQYILRNFNNPLGTCTTEPLLIGDLDKKNLYIHFSVHTIGGNEANKSKIFTCSLFQEQ